MMIIMLIRFINYFKFEKKYEISKEEHNKNVNSVYKENENFE